MNKKVYLVPGWMNTLETYKKYQGLEIWQGDFNLQKPIKADYVIGHSLGANYILLNHRKFSGAKLILIGPLLEKRNCFNWFLRFLKFHSKEGLYARRQLTKGIGSYLKGLFRALKLISQDLFLVMDGLPRESLYVIRGKQDHFLCSDFSAKVLRKKGINMIEVEGEGHNWNNKFHEEIEKIVSNG